MGPDPTPVTVAPLRCGNCAGSFQEGDAACPWCGAGIALEDRGRSHVCARCAVRAPTGARWCPGCGARLGEQPLAPRADAAPCPACGGALRERDVGAHRMTECGGCGGLWLAAALLEELAGAAERAGIAGGAQRDGGAVLRDAGDAPREPAAPRVVYRPCPACRELMQRRNHGGSSGVVVDVCRAHGVWLDAHELERVLAWSRAGGPERERQRRIERARRAETGPARPVVPPLASIPMEREESATDLLEALSGLLRLFR